ncbi:hypothetical protein QMK19_04000 [Streptomyces sp. H10-C2]|uniref:hypothetical protein n=1 Tax=unclassified Streptomyces TaxID=2593676 RepID=UPI0024B90CB5|nr:MULTISPECIES: hypothetical protein [unclassified Streptomyces]MDJ0343559.1 hypothetical protein [Streptomyces sp. PH10-H1]MDJ0368865.1 hypothetical protein [Streptomyces sp. H10-C2]
MSWPQNPQDPQQPPQQPGFGPPPAWTPTGTGPQHTGPQNTGPQYGEPAYGAQPQPPPPAQQQPGVPPGYGAPPQPPSGPGGGSGRKGLYAAIGAVVALAVIGGGIAFAMNRGDGKTDAKPTPGPTTPALSPSASGSSAGTGTDDPGAEKPMIAGWQTQTRDTHQIRYDVPPASAHWKVFPQSVAIAYTGKDGKPIVTMSGTADYREGGCASQANPNSFGTAGKGQLATVGTQGGDTGDVGESARNVAGNWGFAAYGGKEHKPKIEVSAPTPWKHNGIDGFTATAKITQIYHPSSCVPATALVRSIAMKLKDGTVHEWVIYADQGVPGALTPAEIEKIMNTVRPAPAN